MNRWKILTASATSAVLLALAAGPAAPQVTPGPRAVGVEVGMPLVLGVDLSQRMNDRWRVGLALGHLSGLTAIRAEGQMLLRREVRGRFVPLVTFGGEQYFLKDGDLDATPVGIHATIGLDYHTNSRASFTARLGGMKTFGSSGASDAKVFGVKNGFTTGLFNVGIRIQF